ncbi:MAG: tautomerase family protein [Bauldia sp.]
MPLVRISLPAGKPADYAERLSRGVHQALVDIFSVPADDYFQVLTEHAAGSGIARPASYLGVRYSADLVIVQITCSVGRSVDLKQALYARIADNLTAATGLRREDIFISLVESKREDWSFGNGIAQYVNAA